MQHVTGIVEAIDERILISFIIQKLLGNSSCWALGDRETEVDRALGTSSTAPQRRFVTRKLFLWSQTFEMLHGDLTSQA